MKNVARRIQQIRQEKGISLAELADRLHFSIDKLAALENAEIKLTAEDIIEIATALEVTEDHLRRGFDHALHNQITHSTIENSSVSTTHHNTEGNTVTNHYYGPTHNEEEVDLIKLKTQLDLIEQKLDFLLKCK
ncbi:helix-turn-helix domain-containing protein [Rodentibacter caecimuris]|uniref:helix-turn-helix domain-containing protein n=1 Tax=Rodentibacter caecimuris TaxID=1796644 RepID=UPI002248D5BE|nr:helix-turn-helix transcriptional regulator [Rodentibacter heylii]MCX2960330.1 helix-turn-helix transcriptional regulator [Rodentibacter heylii]